MSDAIDNGGRIVGQPDSIVRAPVTLSDLNFAKGFLVKAELVSGDVVSKVSDVIEALNRRSEEESFRQGKETL